MNVEKVFGKKVFLDDGGKGVTCTVLGWELEKNGRRSGFVVLETENGERYYYHPRDIKNFKVLN